MATKQRAGNGFKSLLQQSGQAQGTPNEQRVGEERQSGRRNRPDHTQVAAYIPQSLYKKVRMKLLQEERTRNFSELVEDLLTAYVNS